MLNVDQWKLRRGGKRVLLMAVPTAVKARTTLGYLRLHTVHAVVRYNIELTRAVYRVARDDFNPNQPYSVTVWWSACNESHDNIILTCHPTNVTN